MYLYSMEHAFIMNCFCLCILLFLLLFIKLYARERERERGREVKRPVWGSVAPIAVPFLLIHCCQVAHSTRAHVLLSKQISLELLNKFRWLSNLMAKHFACFALQTRCPLYHVSNWTEADTHTHTHSICIWLLKFVYIFLATNAAATGWREVSSCCALSRDRSMSFYL